MDPTYKKGIGRLATDRYDFQKHIDGTDFRQDANTIDLSPPVTIGAISKNTVQEAVESLAAIAFPPTISDATLSTKGVVKLGGDIGGFFGTANAPVVSGLYGKPISNAASLSLNNGTILFYNGAWTPTSMTLAANNLLTWSGTTWTNSAIAGDVSGTISTLSVDKLKGISLDFSFGPVSGDVLSFNGTDWASSPLPAPSITFGPDVIGNTISQVIEQITGDGIGEVDFLADTINLNDTLDCSIKFKNSINDPGSAHSIFIESQENIGGGDGGSITFQSGNSASANGGSLNINLGNGSSGGGYFSVTAGTASANSGTGGDITISAGIATAPLGVGGDVLINAGSSTNGSGAGNGGSIDIIAGSSADTGNGGSIDITAGNSASAPGAGGDIILTPGKNTTPSLDNGLVKIYYNDSVSSDPLVTVGSINGTSFVGLGGDPLTSLELNSSFPATKVAYIGAGSEPGIAPKDYVNNLPGAFLYAKTGKLYIYEGEASATPAPLNFQIKPPYLIRQVATLPVAASGALTMSYVDILPAKQIDFASYQFEAGDEIILKAYGTIQNNGGAPDAQGAVQMFYYDSSTSGAVINSEYESFYGIYNNHYFNIFAIHKITSSITNLQFTLQVKNITGGSSTVINLLCLEATAIRP